MKKIFSISMVKNEMDIIESFVRYNANILDGMIILDNKSTDDTVKILDQLKNENYPIFIYEDENSEFDKVAKVTTLLKQAVDEFNADIIVPLDADEFIISPHKGNPRRFLEKVETNSYQKVLWKTYIPYLGKTDNEKFIPAKITFARDESIEKSWVKANHKVIIHKNLAKKYDVKVARGSHDLIYDSKYKNLIKTTNNNDLRIAHFPIRLTEQAVSKVSVGWINALSSIERKENHSHHWKKIFNQLKSNKKIEKDDVIKFASEYVLDNPNIEIKVKEEPIDLNFCENIEVKYTNNKVNPMANLLDACENLSLSYLKLKKDNIAEKQGNPLERRTSNQQIHDTQALNESMTRMEENIVKELNSQLNNLTTTIFEMRYLNNTNRSITQRLSSKFPSLYILIKRRNNGLKHVLINIKGYKSIKKNNLMDIGYYLKNNDDVRLSGMDPTLHYMYHVYHDFARRKPNPTFDGDYYLKNNEDVRKSNLNPLVHYSLYGLKEGRKTIPNLKRSQINDKNNTNSRKNNRNKLNAKKNNKIAIKVPSPDWDDAHNWGDYHLALALKKEFEKNNYETVIQMASEWYDETDAGVVLVLRGLVKYNPKPDDFNIIWNISHPYKITIEEYNEYDHVFIASNKWTNELKDKINAPVEPMIQCTDPELFYPESSEKYKHELLFVGNNRRVFRKILKDLLPTKRDLCVYGNYWKDKIDDKYLCGEHINNAELHKVYSSSKILLNDHWDDMRKNGFISNRIFDGFAAGAFIISDEIEGAKEIFGNTLITYSDPNDLKKLIDYYLDNDEERKRIIEEGKNIVLNHHTFEIRAKQILKIIPK